MSKRRRMCRQRIMLVRRLRERKLRGTYWLTRDTIGEIVSPLVDVWLARPERVHVGTVLAWRAPDGCRHERWTLARARREVGPAVPQAGECVRVGPEILS